MDDAGALQQQQDTSSEDEEELQVETLIAGRQRRSNAGNRLAKILGTEEDEAYAEDERQHESLDVDFEDEAEGLGDDVDLGSSSDDEDQEAAADELEGEMELEKQEKIARRAQKRKAQETALKPPAFRKKVKTDPPVGPRERTVPAPRQRKKSERVSWLPTTDEGPTRTSSRKATVQNKEVVYARMKDKEKHRLKQIAIMEAAARRKELAKPKAMTQADRLAEAERTERKNSKSLNRWEETERKRTEEQKARLQALQNRRITGPMIRWYSTPAEWWDGKLKHVGKRSKAQALEDRPEGHAVGDAEVVRVSPAGNATTHGPAQPPSAPSPGLEAGNRPENPLLEPNVEAYASSGVIVHPEVAAGFLDGIHLWASRSPQVQQQDLDAPILPPIHADRQGSLNQNVNLPSIGGNYQHSLPPPPPMPRPAVPLIEHSTRNMVILENFEDVNTKDKDVQRQILFNWSKTKLSKSTPPLCVITMAPAKYRDPKTGLAYSNGYAYKGIQRLLSGTCQWSTLLGCYVGPVYENPVGRPAIGVPERFWAKKSPSVGEQHVKMEEAV